MANRDIRSNEDLARTYGDINQSYRSKGYSPISGTGGSIARGELPSYTRTTTSQRGTNMASPKKTWNELYGPPPGALTPQEWEQQTGNKLLSYSTDNGKLAMNMPMSYRNAEGVAADKAKPAQTEGQVGQSFGKMLGGGAGGFGGGIPSMPELEAASMRLADAAAERERKTEEQRYNRERAGKLADEERSGLQGEISQLRSELNAAQNMQVNTYNDQLLKTRKIAELKSRIQRAENKLRNLDIKERFDAFNRRIR